MRLRSPLVFFVTIAIIATAVIVRAPKTHAPSADNGPVVVATLFPVYDIVRNVAGDAVDVRLLLPPGASPHTFEPNPSTIRSLDGAAAVYAVGHGLDSWADPLATSQGIDVRVLDDGVDLRKEDGGGVDPHYWLAVANAEKMAATAAADLSVRFPDHANEFSANLATYEQRLRALRKEMRTTLSGLPSRSLVTMHDAWYYFAEENGLDLVATVTVSPGKNLTPKQVTALERAVKDAGVKVVYSEPQLSTAPLLPFTEDLGIDIAVLDPLGGTDHDASYAQLMLDNARTVAAHQR